MSIAIDNHSVAAGDGHPVDPCDIGVGVGSHGAHADRGIIEAGRVINERNRADGSILKARGVATERRHAAGGIIEAGGVAGKRELTDGRIESTSVIRQRSVAQRRTGVAQATVLAGRSRQGQNRRPCYRERNDNQATAPIAMQKLVSERITRIECLNMIFHSFPFLSGVFSSTVSLALKDVGKLPPGENIVVMVLFPFTEVLRKIFGSLTRKVWISYIR